MGPMVGKIPFAYWVEGSADGDELLTAVTAVAVECGAGSA